MNNQYDFTEEQWEEFKNEWIEFNLKDIFIIRSSNSSYDYSKIDYSNKEEKLNTFYITRTDANNGVSKIINDKNLDKEKGNVISLGLDTQTIFYQPKDFISGQNIQILENLNFNKYHYLFFVNLLKMEIKRFSWGGFGATLTRIKKISLKLPIRKDQNNNLIIDVSKKYHPDGYLPDFEWMENYIRNLQEKNLPDFKVIKKSKKPNNQYDFTEEQWEEFKNEWIDFKIGDLFGLKNGTKYPLSWRKKGNLPLISTTSENNGVSDYIAKRDKTYNNILSVAYSGSVGEVFYHKNEVFIGETVFAMIPKFKLNSFISMFFITNLKLNNVRYDYGRKIKGTKYIFDFIKLPIEKDQNNNPIIDESKKYHPDGYLPDFEWMENYIKNLSYSNKL